MSENPISQPAASPDSGNALKEIPLVNEIVRNAQEGPTAITGKAATAAGPESHALSATADVEATLAKLDKPERQGVEPDLAQVIAQIDAEIAQLRQRTTEAGLNPWVLVGAMVAIVGLLAPLWESTKDFFSPQTGCAFLTAWLIADGLFPLFTRISARRSRDAGNILLRPGRDFAGRRPLMFVVLLRHVFLIWLLVATARHVSTFLYGGKLDANSPLFCGILYLFEAAQMMWLLWSTRSNRPIPDYVGRGEGTLVFGVPLAQWGGPIFVVFKSLTFLNCAWVYFGAALLGLPASGQPLPATFRAGVLLATLSYLILHYIDILCRPALAERLLAIRLELINREVAPCDALRRIDAIVPRERSGGALRP